MHRRRCGHGVWGGIGLPTADRGDRWTTKRRAQEIADFNTETKLRQLMHFYGLT
jgi:hypothetical protein